MKAKDMCNFTLGMMASVSVMALITDFIGKERYIEWLNSPGGWTDEGTSIIFYSIMLIIIGVLCKKINKDDKHSGLGKAEKKIQMWILLSLINKDLLISDVILNEGRHSLNEMRKEGSAVVVGTNVVILDNSGAGIKSIDLLELIKEQW